MKYRQLCPMCMNYSSEHPETCRCTCHVEQAFQDIQYHLKKLGDQIRKLGETFSKIQMP